VNNGSSIRKRDMVVVAGHGNLPSTNAIHMRTPLLLLSGAMFLNVRFIKQ
jgi:hypothetical protein